MTELLTAGQMRAVETAAIESEDVCGAVLMERAGQGVVDAIFEEWPAFSSGQNRAIVLCGPGNNGGDGFVVARHLVQRGWEVDVFLFGAPDRLPPDARLNYEKWRALGPVNITDPKGGADHESGGLHAFVSANGEPDIYIDAVFGTGLRRPVDTNTHMGHDFLAALAQRSKGAKAAKVVAVDIPSGLCADSGRVLTQSDAPLAPFADLTVSFHRAKLGHMLADGPERCGKLVVKGIGLNRWQGASGTEQTVKTAEISNTLPSLGKSVGHKFDHGHALVFSGGVGRTGAARLAARGALRIGAGLVTLAVPPKAQSEVASQITALMQTPVADKQSVAEVLRDTRITALCLGPGMGLGAEQSEIIGAALNGGRTTVLDADALSILAQDAALFEALHPRCVLTPHGGEFGRLFPTIAEKLRAAPTQGPAFSKVDATKEAAQKAGCVVLFKGADTVIADPNGRCVVHAAAYDRAAPWLATAGAGDVLAGFITGLAARGFDPMAAATTATWLHVECARRFGPGLIAEDLPEELPDVFRALGL